MGGFGCAIELQGHRMEESAVAWMCSATKQNRTNQTRETGPSSQVFHNLYSCRLLMILVQLFLPGQYHSSRAPKLAKKKVPSPLFWASHDSRLYWDGCHWQVAFWIQTAHKRDFSSSQSHPQVILVVTGQGTNLTYSKMTTELNL